MKRQLLLKLPIKLFRLLGKVFQFVVRRGPSDQVEENNSIFTKQL